MHVGNCSPARERHVYSVPGPSPITSLKPFGNAIPLAHFIGRETKAKEASGTWFNDSRQKVELELQPTMPCPTRDNTILKVERKESGKTLRESFRRRLC